MVTNSRATGERLGFFDREKIEAIYPSRERAPMPKSQTIKPTGVRASQFIDFSPIPVNQYRGSLIDELASGNLCAATRLEHGDMVLIRAFESMLESVKKWGHYGEVKYDHRGPAHLSIGQEAVAVGQAFLLDIHDHIFGSTEATVRFWQRACPSSRSSTIQRCSRSCPTISAAHVSALWRSGSTAAKDLAVDFLVFGTLAEIFGRESGFNRGLGGSIHAFFTPFGVYPNNAIVGGSADIAVGAAPYKHVHGKPGIAIANIGDAAAGCGPT